MSAPAELLPTAAADFALRGVGKSFAGVFACRGIDLNVRCGEVLAIAGENGAGKSTLMKCLHGYYLPSEGHIEIRGVPVSFRSPRDAEAAGIAMIPQEVDLFPELSVAENLFVGRKRPRARWGGFDVHAMQLRAREILASLKVELDVAQPVRCLAAAHCKLVEIARALNQDARLIIMDEPTAALTEREAENLFGVVAQLRARGLAVIYITHRLEEIFRISDRLVVLRDGALVAAGPTSDFDTSQLIAAMVGRPLEQLFVRNPHPPGETVLELRKLARRGQFTGIDLALRSGEVLGVAGLIGAGRTALAQALFGIAPADSGEILIGGRAVRIRSVADAVSLGIAYLPEERRSQGLVLPFSITQNISFAVLARFTRFGFVARRREACFAQEEARRFSIRGADVEAPVEVLSGGNQQKVLIAKVLALDPRIIVFDEPTRGVDVGAKTEIYAVIDALAREGKAILLISSEMNELFSMADRILVMCKGRVTGTFERDEFSAAAIGAAAAGVARSRA